MLTSGLLLGIGTGLLMSYVLHKSGVIHFIDPCPHKTMATCRLSLALVMTLGIGGILLSSTF